MATAPELTLSRSQIAAFIVDPGAAVAYVQDVYGNAVPDDMWDLLYHLSTVLGLVSKEISERRLGIELAIDEATSRQLAGAHEELKKLQGQWDMIWELNQEAMERPMVATPEWVRLVRDPVVRGINPQTGERSIAWASMPFILLKQVLVAEADFAERLSNPAEYPFAVFETVARSGAKLIAEGAEEAIEIIVDETKKVIKREAPSILPWLFFGAAGLYLLTRK